MSRSGLFKLLVPVLEESHVLGQKAPQPVGVTCVHMLEMVACAAWEGRQDERWHRDRVDRGYVEPDHRL